jgi:hypothetical protein
MRKFVNIALGISLLTGLGFASGTAQAETVGNSLVSRSVYDGAIGSLFVMTNSGFTTPGTLSTWGFYDGSQPTNFQITPVIFQFIGGSYTVTGVGTTQTNTQAGAQSFAFGLTAGSSVVGSGYFFGWRDGNASGTVTNAGVPMYDGGGVGTVRWFGAADATVGSTPTPNTDFNRTYSLQGVSSAASAPEPGTVVLAVLGAMPLIGSVRARRRA